jgi:hypothetical protein
LIANGAGGARRGARRRTLLRGSIGTRGKSRSWNKSKTGTNAGAVWTRHAPRGRDIHELIATKFSAHRAPNLLRRCFGRTIRPPRATRGGHAKRAYRGQAGFAPSSAGASRRRPSGIGLAEPDLLPPQNDPLLAEAAWRPRRYSRDQPSSRFSAITS